MNQRLHKWLPWLLLAVAVLVTGFVYWPGVTGGWIFDDYPNIVANNAIHITRGHAGLPAWAAAALSSPASFLHRPLASLTFAANWYFGGANPWGYKVVNIAIHLVNGVLLYGMLRALLRLAQWRQMASSRIREGWGVGLASIDETAATRLALVVATAWMLLPINLLGVLYVVQRMASLAQVFVLAGLWAYLHGRWMMLTATDARRDRRGFALAAGGIVLGTAVGVASKESAVLLPAFAFLAEWLVAGFTRASAHAPTPAAASPEATLEQTPPSRPTLDKRIWALFTVTLFVPAVLGTAWLLRHALAHGAFAHRTFTLAQRLLTEPRVLVDYLHWTLLPNPMVLSLYHDEIKPSTGLLHPWTTLAAIAFLLALLATGVWLRKRRPLVALGIAWFFASQLLTATIVPLELVYEQRMYFGSVGVLLAAGALLLGLRWRITMPILRGFLVCAAIVWFGIATNLRAREWSNPVWLAVSEANHHPDSPRAVYEAGRQLVIRSQFQTGKDRDNAIRYLENASALPGSSTLPEQALLIMVDHLKHGDDAAYWRSMVRKLRDQPTSEEDITALVSLSDCYGKGDCRFDPADLQRAYEAALSRPHPEARLSGAYGNFLNDEMGNPRMAAIYFARAVASAPAEPTYRFNLAAASIALGQPAKAREQLDALRKMNYGGRLDGRIATLERMLEQARAHRAHTTTGAEIPATSTR